MSQLATRISDGQYNAKRSLLTVGWRILLVVVRIHLQVQRALILEVTSGRVTLHVGLWGSDEFPGGALVVRNESPDLVLVID